MRISKSTKTSVKASTDKCSYAYWQEEIMDERLAGLDSDVKYEEYLKWKNNNCSSVKGAGIDIDNVCACDDVKASKKVYASLNRKVVYDKDGIKVTTTGRDYDFIATIENDTDDEYCVEELGLCVPAHDWVGFLADDEGYSDLEYFESLSGVKACGDVKASRTEKEKFLGTALLENRDDGKIHLNNFPVAPNDRCRYMWKNTMFPTTWNTIDEAIDAIESTLGVRVDRDKLAEMTEPTDHTVLLYLYGTNKAIMSTTTVSANDKALQHIKAAIDILGKSGNKDAVTKDSIANLGVVMFDLKSKK